MSESQKYLGSLNLEESGIVFENNDSETPEDLSSCIDKAEVQWNSDYAACYEEWDLQNCTSNANMALE